MVNEIRASSLHQAMACVGSLSVKNVLFEEAGQAAKDGTIVVNAFCGSSPSNSKLNTFMISYLSITSIFLFHKKDLTPLLLVTK